mgnify:FL=1
MFDQGFQLLRRTDLDAALSDLFRGWDPSPQERAEFVGWAWVVAAGVDRSAIENRFAPDLLRRARGETNAEELGATSSTALHLVSKHRFLDWLAGALPRERAA